MELTPARICSRPCALKRDAFTLHKVTNAEQGERHMRAGDAAKLFSFHNDLSNLAGTTTEQLDSDTKSQTWNCGPSSAS